MNDQLISLIIGTAFGGMGLEILRRWLTRPDRVFTQQHSINTTQFDQALEMIDQQHKQSEQARQETIRLVARIETLEGREDATKAIEAERMAQMRDLQTKVEFLTQRLTAASLERDMYLGQVNVQNKKIMVLEQELATLRHDLNNKEDR